MTPQEKAYELYNKGYTHIFNDKYDKNQLHIKSQEVALWVIEEMIYNIIDETDEPFAIIIRGTKRWWKGVKEELLKIKS